MKKLTGILSILVILTMLLAACGTSADEGGEGVETLEPGMTEESKAGGGVPGTGGTSAAAPTLEATSSLGGEATLAPTQSASPTVAATSSGGTVATPGATSQATAQATGEAGGGLPGTGQANRNNLSRMFEYFVVDSEGNDVGQVRDYVINMCEAHIIYVVLDLTDDSGELTGESILVPYGAFVQGNPGAAGSIDVNNRLLSLEVEADVITNAPRMTAAEIDLTTGAFETDLMSYWSQYVTTDLTVNCPVPPAQISGTPGAQSTAGATAATPVMTGTAVVTPTSSVGAGSGSTDGRVNVIRLAFARDLVKANLEDGNGNQMGQVEDFVMVPETGLLRYVIVRLTPGAGSNAGGNAGGVSGTASAPSVSGTANAPGASGTAAPGASGNAQGGKMVLVPLGAVTIRDAEEGDMMDSGSGSAAATTTPEPTMAAGTPAATYEAGSDMSGDMSGDMDMAGEWSHPVVLVLLVEPEVLLNAPTMNALPNTGGQGWDSDAFSYWEQYVPMTREQLP